MALASVEELQPLSVEGRLRLLAERSVDLRDGYKESSLAQVVKTMPEYLEWIKDKGHVMDVFMDMANKKLGAGQTKGSHWDFANAMRWDDRLKIAGEPYKIPNGHIGWMARHAVALQPVLTDFFNLKVMSGSGEKPD